MDSHLSDSSSETPASAPTSLLLALKRFCDLANQSDSGVALYHALIASVHEVCALIAQLEEQGLTREDIVAWCQEARTIHASSPFIKRLQTWPRGYQGDFETVEYLMQQAVKAPSETPAYWLEYLALSSPIAQQHRNKMEHQRQLVASLPVRDKPWKILILACGSCPDLYPALDVLGRRKDLNFVLCDGDEGAIEEARRRLSPIEDKCDFISTSVMTSARTLAKHGPYDLIMCGGLFDYLPDRQATFLLRQIHKRLLGKGGRCFLTNIAVGNPYRHWVEYMADWRLIERSAREMKALIEKAWEGLYPVKLSKEGSGLAWLLEAKNAPLPAA